jgi:hypothetical protein
VESRVELHLLFPGSHVFRNSHPAMKEMEVPQGPAWAEVDKPRILEFIAHLDSELRDRPFIAGDAFHGSRHHRSRRRRFHEAGKARGAGRIQEFSSAGTLTLLSSLSASA